MEKVAIDEVEQAVLSGPTDRRALSDALGTTDVTIMYYELDPGDRLSAGYHTHLDQEEIFYVFSGTATFKTESGTIEVESGEAVRFAPGDFQHGYNHYDADDPVTVLAIGAPPGMDETVSIFECAGCGERAKHDVDLDPEAGTMGATCRECGFEL